MKVSYTFFVLSILIVICTSRSEAQIRLIGEQSVYTSYYLNPVLVNPGATGFEDYHQVILNYRNTWASFPGSPSTGTLSYNGPMGNRVGFGVLAYSDSFGALNTTKGQVSLSYNLDLPNNKLGIGISAEYIQHKLSGDAVLSDFVDFSDPEIISRLGGSQYFDASIGIFGIYDNKFIYGIALPSVISQRLDDASTALIARDFGVIANIGYRYDIPDKDIVSGDAVLSDFVDFSDPEIISRLGGSQYFDASIGIFGIYDNKFIYGIALPSVISQRLDDASTALIARDFGVIANIGYRYDIPDKDIVIEPSIYAKQLMLVPFHVDINLRLGLLDEKINMGLTYSNGAEDRLGFLIGSYIDNFGIFYAYNASLNQFQNYNNGSHELSLKLKLLPLDQLREQ